MFGLAIRKKMYIPNLSFKDAGNSQKHRQPFVYPGVPQNICTYLLYNIRAKCNVTNIIAANDQIKSLPLGHTDICNRNPAVSPRVVRDQDSHFLPRGANLR